MRCKIEIPELLLSYGLTVKTQKFVLSLSHSLDDFLECIQIQFKTNIKYLDVSGSVEMQIQQKSFEYFCELFKVNTKKVNLEIKYLDVSQKTGRVHPACLVDGVAPDVKHWLGCPYDPADQGPHRHADTEHEVVEGVLVDVVKFVVELRSKVDQVTEMVIRIVLRQQNMIQINSRRACNCSFRSPFGYIKYTNIEHITFCNFSQRKARYR